jgi:MFS family permease
MSSNYETVSASPAIKEHFSTRLAFFIAGFCLASWAPLVPLAKSRSGIDDGMLGLLLLGLGAGSIVAMPLAGYLVSRVGCKRVIVVSALIICAALPFLAFLSNIYALAAAILVFGIGMGALDCSMNIQAVIVDRASPRSVMSSFHGFFSLGGIIGAAGMTLCLSLGLSALASVSLFVIITLVVLLKVTPDLLPYGEKNEGPAFALPHGVVLFLGILCFIVFLTEGAMLDWSAIFLTSERGLDKNLGGLGYASFAATMTLMRLVGDAVVMRFGGRKVLVLGAVLAACGLALSLSIDDWRAAVIGYGLVGIGCANIVPVLFTLVGQQTSMPKALAIPAMTTLGYAGVLVGPAFIGFIAHSTSLAVAFGIVTVSLIGVAIAGRFLPR